MRARYIFSFFIGIFLSMTSSVSALEIKKEVERIGDLHFYRQDMIEFLYSRQPSYRKLFDCQSVAFEDLSKENEVTALCITKNDALSIEISLSSNGRASSLSICPLNLDVSIIPILLQNSYESKQTGYATLYRMGETSSFRKNFENVFLKMRVDGVDLYCWKILKR